MEDQLRSTLRVGRKIEQFDKNVVAVFVKDSKGHHYHCITIQMVDEASIVSVRCPLRFQGSSEARFPEFVDDVVVSPINGNCEGGRGMSTMEEIGPNSIDSKVAVYVEGTNGEVQCFSLRMAKSFQLYSVIFDPHTSLKIPSNVSATQYLHVCTDIFSSCNVSSTFPVKQVLDKWTTWEEEPHIPKKPRARKAARANKKPRKTKKQVAEEEAAQMDLLGAELENAICGSIEQNEVEENAEDDALGDALALALWDESVVQNEEADKCDELGAALEKAPPEKQKRRPRKSNAKQKPKRNLEAAFMHADKRVHSAKKAKIDTQVEDKLTLQMVSCDDNEEQKSQPAPTVSKEIECNGDDRVMEDPLALALLGSAVQLEDKQTKPEVKAMAELPPSLDQLLDLFDSLPAPAPNQWSPWQGRVMDMGEPEVKEMAELPPSLDEFDGSLDFLDSVPAPAASNIIENKTNNVEPNQWSPWQGRVMDMGEPEVKEMAELPPSSDEFDGLLDFLDSVPAPAASNIIENNTNNVEPNQWSPWQGRVMDMGEMMYGDESVFTI